MRNLLVTNRLDQSSLGRVRPPYPTEDAARGWFNAGQLTTAYCGSSWTIMNPIHTDYKRNIRGYLNFAPRSRPHIPP